MVLTCGTTGFAAETTVRRLEDLWIVDLHVRLFPKMPELHPEDLKLVLEEIALTNPKAKGADPAAFMDDRVVRELAKSGYVEQLYK